MLVIRMQRTGRKGHAQFRVVVQDSRRTPTSGKIVASLGHYDPHTKTTQIDTEKTVQYLNNGAQPTERVVRLLKAEGVKLPAWVKQSDVKTGKLRNPDKLRKNRPAEEKPAVDVPAEESAAETETAAEAAETTAAPDTEEKASEAADTSTDKPSEAAETPEAETSKS